MRDFVFSSIFETTEPPSPPPTCTPTTRSSMGRTRRSPPSGPRCSGTTPTALSANYMKQPFYGGFPSRMGSAFTSLEPQACGGSVTRQSRRQFSRDIFLSCLSDQPNIACLMIIRGVLHPIFHSFLFFCIFFTVNNTILGDMIERLDVTHLL